MIAADPDDDPAVMPNVIIAVDMAIVVVAVTETESVVVVVGEVILAAMDADKDDDNAVDVALLLYLIYPSSALND